MKQISLKESFFIFLIVLFFSFFFVTKGNAQCSITTTRNTTGLVCGTSPISGCGGILYIGDGTNAMTLTMTSNLDLSCLGPMRFIIRNGAVVDFSSGNYDLQLAEGSSIEIEQGGQLGAASNCSASDLIKIGTVKVASCNGEGGGVLTNFPGLVANGGYSSISVATPAPVCNSGSFEIAATANPSSGATYKWYTTPSGGSPVYTGNPYITDVISTTTTYYVEAVYSGYTTVRKAVTATVNPNLPASVSISASANSVCSGVSVTFTATPINGGAAPSYQWKLNGGNIGSNSATYTNAALVNGDIVACVMTSNATPCLTGSPATSNSITTTVLAPPSAPVVGTITHPSCTTSKGSLVLTGLPSVPWVLYQNKTTGGQVTYSGNGTESSFKVTGLESGTYYFNVSNGTCLSPQLANVVINPSPATKTWNGTAWSPDPSVAPTIENKVVFNGNYSSSSNLDACSCDVGNAVVTFNSGHALKVVNNVNVAGNGTLTFENNASLVQVNDAAVNSGNINYNRNTTSILNTDYVYWSSPVAGFTLGGIQTGTLYYSFNATGNSWVRGSASTMMTAGKGYIVRGAGTGFTTGVPFVKTVTFTGQPNNGVFTAAIGGANTFNLIGNPYPSAIDADAFLTANAEVLDGSLYFWTHNTAIQLASNITNGTAGSGTYAYTSDDYAIYNLTGGTVTVSGTPIPTGKIAAGQGFMATGFAAGNAVFNNSMRLGAGGAALDNSQFFKQTPASKTSGSVEKSRIWLNLTNAQGAFKQMLVGYITGATNDYDRVYDGVSNNGNRYIDFYSVNEDKNLTIQGRALPFEAADEVPLGYSSTIAGEFTISIANADGLLKDQNVFLEDKVFGAIHNLRLGSYTFTTDKGTFKDRFLLVYRNKNEVIEEEVIPAVGTEVLVSVKNRVITIYSPAKLLDKVVVHDVSGKKIYQKEKVNLNDLEILHLQSIHEVLIVTAILEDKTTVAKKIMF